MNSKQFLSTVAVLSLVLFFGWLSAVYWPRENDSPAGEEDVKMRSPGLVRLSEARRAFAGISTSKVTRRDLSVIRSLPARFTYDESRHVAVRTPTPGIVESVSVKPGDQVEEGQLLAVVRSPAIGAARSKLLRSASERDLAADESDWRATIHGGVKKLVSSVRRRQSLDEIKQQLGDSTLGRYRSDLLGKYSQLLLAEKRLASAAGISQSGAISGSTLQQRQSEQEQANAELEAAIEQALFESEQARRRSQSASRNAQRDLVVARQELMTSLGTHAGAETVAEIQRGRIDLARLEIRSPLSGTVEQRLFSATERVAADDQLFVVADTSVLWVQADLRGGDWSVTRISPGQTVEVTTPASPGTVAEAEIHFVGREVDSASGTIPLVARIDNASDRFRPGLFARMQVAVERLANVIAVPDAAVIDIDGEAHVFVADKEGFRPVEVQIGQRSATFVEVRSGLKEGQRVVDEGAFVLKSELLLDGEG